LLRASVDGVDGRAKADDEQLRCMLWVSHDVMPIGD